MKIKLTDADRARYGAPEWLDGNLERLLVSEAEAFQANVRDAQGNAIALGKYAEWIRAAGVIGVKWRMWLGLHRAGVGVDWAEFDPDLLGAEFDAPAATKPAVPSEGKASGRSTRQRRSASAESSTPQL